MVFSASSIEEAKSATVLPRSLRCSNSVMLGTIPQQGTLGNAQMYPTGVLTVCTRYGHNARMLSHNIATLRSGRGISQSDLAKKVGTTLSMFGKLERGERELSSSWIEKISGALDVEPFMIFAPLDEHGHLRSGRGLGPGEAANDDTVEIISLDLSLSMGPGTLIEEFVESEPVRFDLTLLQAITRTPSDRLRFVRGIGDSMEPTLRTGDRVLIDINDRQLTRINGIYWIDHFGMHGIKRLRAISRTRYMVMSDNRDVAEPFEVDANDVRIEGRAIWFARDL